MGFGMVFFILLLLIAFMLLMGRFMHKKKTELSTQAKVEAEHVDSFNSKDIKGDRVTAAIAYSLYLYFGKGQDIEPTKITIAQHSTQWNSKIFGMNNLHRQF